MLCGSDETRLTGHFFQALKLTKHQVSRGSSPTSVLTCEPHILVGLMV